MTNTYHFRDKALSLVTITETPEAAAFMVRTTFPGADKASKLYFSTDDEAQAFLDTCDNGEIEGVTIIGVDKLPSEGCTWNEIEYHGGLEVLG